MLLTGLPSPGQNPGSLAGHDTDTIEALTDSRPRSSSWTEEDVDDGPGVEGGDAFGDDVDGLGGSETGGRVSAGGRELLKFSSPRDPVQLARFVRLRVLEPEGEYWRRGIEACARWVKETGAVQLRVSSLVVDKVPVPWPCRSKHRSGFRYIPVTEGRASGRLVGTDYLVTSPETLP